MNTEQLNTLVKSEAKKLKQNATLEELVRLDFSRLNPSNAFRCIYGQMTGDCFSQRASDLIYSCAGRIYNANDAGMGKAELNGKPEKLRKSYKHYSPIEIYIYKEENRLNGNNKSLIEYLKGQTKTLKIK